MKRITPLPQALSTGRVTIDADGVEITPSPVGHIHDDRYLPRMGRITPELHGTADSIIAPGYYEVWSSADAVALGLPGDVAGILQVYAFGNVVEQIYRQHFSKGILFSVRRKLVDTWSPFTPLAADDDAVSGLIAPGTKTHSAIQRVTSGGTKTAAVSLSTGRSGAETEATNMSFRYPVKLGADARRFRVHIQNTNPRYGNRIYGELEFAGLGIARNRGEITGPAAEGQLDPGTWRQISGAFTSDHWGWEWVSEWIDQPLKGGEGWLLSGGFTASAGQTVTALVGGGWVTDSATDWNVPAPTNLSLTQSVGLWVWLEVEIDAKTPVVMYFGDSLASGVSARLPVYDGIGNRHSWAHGHIATLYTNSGTSMADHTADENHFRWTRYGTATGLARPDGCVFEMGSNDIFDGASLGTAQTRYAICQDIITRNLTPRIVGMTVLPRHDSASPQEDVRQQFNEWLLTEKAGELVAVVDAAAPLADHTDPRVLDQRWTASPTDIHLTASGYARFMQSLPSMHI